MASYAEDELDQSAVLPKDVAILSELQPLH